MAAITSIRLQGAPRQIVKASAFHAGALRILRSIKVMDGDNVRTVALFASPLSAAISPSSVIGAAPRPEPSTAITGPVVCIPTGGASPFTYVWSRVSGDIFTIQNAGTATVRFSRANVAATELFQGLYRCTVTDAVGQTASADVNVQLTNDWWGY
ncbi:hypothetical protein M2336_001657 [Sphingobium sp. B1D7B]|uniref:PKD domain-containing protein n=1 Tax=Sphingobium sp. B1D7B TaxID=2940578 RepID=UPI0022243AAA|nr:hypothetical protein [Sphingobium sp. B1D7B]MCW2405028.1 hypothetical protein [Sphingobium sp. B1D7B]